VKNNNIILIGFMGSGKTTVAEILSHKLTSFSLVDLDKEIEAVEERQISEIFKTDGEEYFRSIESEVLLNKLQISKLIVSTGGGVILKEKNRKALTEAGLVFWLYATSEKTYERIKDDNSRPLINTATSKVDVIKKIEDIMDVRFDLYKDTANVIINTDKFSPEECADEILKEFELLNS
jgi:shikimate dehydrogenase